MDSRPDRQKPQVPITRQNPNIPTAQRQAALLAGLQRDAERFAAQLLEDAQLPQEPPSAPHSSIVALAGKQYVVFRTATGIVLRVYEIQPVPGRPPSVFTLHELKRWPKKLTTFT